MAQLRWSLTASTDLQEIEDFIARDSVLHAITFVDCIVDSSETLLKTPLLDVLFPSSIAKIFEKLFLGDTGSCTSCRMTRSSFFASCMAHEIYSDSSGENLGI
jgi:hypothetical protein